jgi:Transposase IS116/IS110/IS902 family
MSATPEAIQKLSRDLRNAAKLMGVREARYFVDSYYDLQDYRIAAANQQRKLLEGAEPSEFMGWLNDNLTVLEKQIAAVLDKWSGAQPMGIWARNICGIGPVIASGLLANIDITKAPTVGHIWRFAGLDPTSKWSKGTKRPWNASLKRLCWLMGESFVKVSGNKNDRYGKLYLERKAYEQKRNDAGELSAIAAERLTEGRKKKLDPELLKIFESGKLPPIAMHARAKRWAVKLFLAHWHAEAYRLHYRMEPPKPYPIAILGHAHLIEP